MAEELKYQSSYSGTEVDNAVSTVVNALGESAGQSHTSDYKVVLAGANTTLTPGGYLTVDNDGLLVTGNGDGQITITTTAGSESISDGEHTLNVATRNTEQAITGIKKFDSGALKFKAYNGSQAITKHIIVTTSLDDDAHYEPILTFGCEDTPYNTVTLVSDGVLAKNNIRTQTVCADTYSTSSSEDPLEIHSGLNHYKFRRQDISVSPVNMMVASTGFTEIAPSQTAARTFSNGQITLPVSLFTGDTTALIPGQGLYLFTYGNVQAFLFINSDMVTYAGSGAPIRTSMPVIYNDQGSTKPGMLRIDKSGDNFIIKVSDGTRSVYNGFELHIYRTNLA